MNPHHLTRLIRNPVGGRDGWEYRWEDGGGRHRVFRRAKTEAAAHRREAIQHLTAGEYLDGAVWVKDSLSALIAELDLLTVGTGLSVQQLTEMGRLAWLARHSGRGEALSMDQAVKDFTTAKKDEGISGDYLKALQYRLARFGGDLGGSVDELTPTRIEKWFAGLELKAKTRKHFFMAVSEFTRWCVDRKQLPENFKMGFKAPKVRRGEINIFTPSELRILLQHSGNSLKPALMLGAFAGLRTDECFKLHWRHVLWEKNRIEVPGNTKTGRRLAPLLPGLRAWLEPLAGEGPVMGISINGYTKSIVRTVARANAALKNQNATWRVTWKANALRHSFVTYRCAIKDNHASVARECGHSVATLQKCYDAVKDEDVASSWFMIPALPDLKVVSTGGESSQLSLLWLDDAGPRANGG